MEASRVATAIGVEIVRRFAHGEGAGSYEVRTPHGERAVLKIGSPSALEIVDVLRSRNYPIPAMLARGDEYELWSFVAGAPIEQLTRDRLAAVLALNDLQGDAGAGPTWREDMVESVLEGCDGYCELHAVRAHDPMLLGRLQRIARGCVGLDIRAHDAVHFDFSPLNILVEGNEITGVVDWQGARYGDRTFDLVALAFYTYDASVRDALLDAARIHSDPRALQLYGAHIVLRQVDWSLRHQSRLHVDWFTAVGNDLLDVLAL